MIVEVVEPVLETCPDLVRSSASAAVVTAVLTLMQDVTTKVSIYIDHKVPKLPFLRIKISELAIIVSSEMCMNVFRTIL